MSDTQETDKKEVPLMFDVKYVKHYDKVLPHYSGMLRTAMDLKLAKLKQKATQLIHNTIKILDVGSGFGNFCGLTYCRNKIPNTNDYTYTLELTNEAHRPMEQDHTWTIQVFESNSPKEFFTRGIKFHNDHHEHATLNASYGSLPNVEVRDARFEPLQYDMTTLHDLVVQLTRIHSAERSVKLAEDVINTFTRHIDQVLGHDLVNELEKYGIPGYDFWNHGS